MHPVCVTLDKKILTLACNTAAGGLYGSILKVRMRTFLVLGRQRVM